MFNRSRYVYLPFLLFFLIMQSNVWKMSHIMAFQYSLSVVNLPPTTPPFHNSLSVIGCCVYLCKLFKVINIKNRTFLYSSYKICERKNPWYMLWYLCIKQWLRVITRTTTKNKVTIH